MAGIERVIKSASWTSYPEFNSTAVDSAVIWPVCSCFECNFVLVAGEVHSQETPLILDERRCNLLAGSTCDSCSAILLYLSLSCLLSFFCMPIALLIIPHDVLICPREQQLRHALGSPTIPCFCARSLACCSCSSF